MKFGENMQLLIVSFVGDLNRGECMDLTIKITETIGLHIPVSCTICDYPTNQGKGGVGFTFFQPITESFIVWDIWSELKGGYLIICSCKLFWVPTVIKILRKNQLEPMVVKSEYLCLNPLGEL